MLRLHEIVSFEVFPEAPWLLAEAFWDLEDSSSARSPPCTLSFPLSTASLLLLHDAVQLAISSITLFTMLASRVGTEAEPRPRWVYGRGLSPFSSSHFARRWTTMIAAY
jgi:hypothetical protein